MFIGGGNRAEMNCKRGQGSGIRNFKLLIT
jgi:hypothetical protein